MIISLSHQTYDIAWYITVGGFLVSFGIFESWAFVNGKPDEDTLSGHVWKWIGTRRGWSGFNIPLRVVAIGLFLWLAEHFGFGWF